MYSLAVLHLKVYVAQDEKLISPLQRSRTLSVTPALRKESKIHAGLSEHGHAVFDGKVLEDFGMRTRKAFAPGEQLDELSMRLAREALGVTAGLISGQDDIGLLIVGGKGIAVGAQLREDALGVDESLRTAERNHADLGRCGELKFHEWRPDKGEPVFFLGGCRG